MKKGSLLKETKKREVSGAAAIAIGAAAGTALQLVVAYAAAAVLAGAAAPEDFYGAVSFAVAAVSGLVCGVCTAAIGGGNGLLRGVFAGLAVSAATLAAGLIMPSESAFSASRAALSCAIVTLSSGAGGFLPAAIFHRR